MTRLTVPAGVGVVVVAEVVYAAPLPDGPIAVLEGVAAFIWHAALAGERDDVAAQVAAATGRDVAEVGAAVEGFLDDLVARGLLMPAHVDAEQPARPAPGAA